MNLMELDRFFCTVMSRCFMSVMVGSWKREVSEIDLLLLFVRLNYSGESKAGRNLTGEGLLLLKARSS